MGVLAHMSISWISGGCIGVRNAGCCLLLIIWPFYHLLQWTSVVQKCSIYIKIFNKEENHTFKAIKKRSVSKLSYIVNVFLILGKPPTLLTKSHGYLKAAGDVQWVLHLDQVLCQRVESLNTMIYFGYLEDIMSNQPGYCKNTKIDLCAPTLVTPVCYCMDGSLPFGHWEHPHYKLTTCNMLVSCGSYSSGNHAKSFKRGKPDGVGILWL